MEILNKIQMIVFFNKNNQLKIDDGFDINDINKEGKCTKYEAAIQIANAIMGAGILALPIMMKKLGILLGSFNIIIAAFLTIYSVKVLLRSKSLTKQ